MTTYWDTSAVINAAISSKVMDRLKTGEHVTRLHTLAEFFATMTGRGVRFTDKATGEDVYLVFTPDECAEWLRSFVRKLRFVELSEQELLSGLSRAQRLNVQGAKVYDYWHSLAAAKAKAGELLTRNTDDFAGLARVLAWP